ncbi:urease accessory protein UreD [Protomyces lactucae-debilis]|uniref:Urease accessory protein UreD n=1 Tax=Protomyces lactucae-debilis TaxID=2754530 RepID=A0A1Y2FDA2_PROLT|nr:urease accessory protein UreD [Protomyces lactucae-debilis]ORY81903.1 urease accessory protein UreD [Protomyces lactucae-debilis]
MLSYGGGLVGGDCIALDATIGEGATLALLTQGSTKVFKVRPHGQLSSSVPSKHERRETRQILDVRIAHAATVVLLPDPVQPFTDAKYNQEQRFHLADTTSSCIVLDWILGGRVANGEIWAFERYKSINHIFLAGDSQDRLLLRDAQLLERQSGMARQFGRRHCLATLLLAGPETQKASTLLLAKFKGEERIMGFRSTAASAAAQEQEESLIWTVTQHRGVTVLKCVGGHGSSEQVKGFLSDIVNQVGWRHRFGRDAFRALE